MHHRRVCSYSQILLNTLRCSNNTSKYQQKGSATVLRYCNSNEIFQCRYQGIKTISGTGLSYPKSPASAKPQAKITQESQIDKKASSSSISIPTVDNNKVPGKVPDANQKNSTIISSSENSPAKDLGEGTENENSDYYNHRYPSLLEKQIHSAKSISDLLNLASISSIILKHACLLVFRLGQMMKSDKSFKLETLHGDSRFIKLCNLIKRGNYLHNPQSLFLAIHGLLKLGIDPASELYQSLNSELKWAMRRCPIKHLAKAADLFSVDNLLETYSGSISKNHLDDPLNIFETAIISLQRRWVEVNSGSDFILVFKILPFLNDETRVKLEDRAAELVQDFTPQEIRMMFIVLGAQRRRPTPLLRSLAFHYSKSEEGTANAKDLIELTYALNELTFADPVLMEKLCSSLCPEIPSVENAALISSLVTSLGQMRYKHKGLLHIVDEWIISHLNQLRPFDCASWLLTCAVLNYQSSNVVEFCNKAKSLLTQKSASSQTEWINIVHSLLVLDQHNDQILATVLDPQVSDFIESLGVKSIKSKIKLLNINSVAKSRITSGYKGSLLDPKLESRWSESCLASTDSKLSSVAIETLNSFMPAEKYLKLNQKLPAGIFIDATCLLNEALEPLPTATDNNQTKFKPGAIIIEGYSATCLGHKDPTGQTALNRRILQSEGYHVIPLIYTEFSSSEKLIRRVKYVEQKIKSLKDHKQISKKQL